MVISDGSCRQVNYRPVPYSHNYREEELKLHIKYELTTNTMDSQMDLKIFKDRSLGSGAYGMVCRAKYNQLPCAAKLLHSSFLAPGNYAVDRFAQECEFLSSLKHPHIVQFLGVHTDPSTNQTALLMELMDESLTTFLSRYSLNSPVPLHTQVNICHDVSLALHYLHINNIIHRDLSSNNVLLLGGRRAKITDFGMSKLTPNSSPLSSMTQVPGCPVYMPPEAWVTPPMYTNKLDIFSMGVIMVQLVTCKMPNPGPMEELIPDERSPTGYLKLPVSEVDRRSEDISLIPSGHPLHETAIRCLSGRPEARPTAKELCQLFDTLKASQQYIESSELVSSTCTTQDCSRISNCSDVALDSMKSNLSQKESEVQELKSQLSSCRLELENLKTEVDKRVTSNKLQNPKEELKSENLLSSGVEIVTLSGLSPEVLAILSRSLHKADLGVDYDIGNGLITYYHHPDKVWADHLKMFVPVYEHLLNSGQMKVQYVALPATFSLERLPSMIETCLASHELCYFEHIASINMIKVVSKSLEYLKLSCQLVDNLLHHQIALDSKRCLSVKMAEITEEEVDAVMSLSMPSLTCGYGLANRLNLASHFQLQKHCQEYLKKNGPLKMSQVMHVPAGGSLKCKWVILAIAPRSSYLQESATEKARTEVDRCIREMVYNILLKAEKLKASSIALCEIAPTILNSEDYLGAIAVIETILNFKYNHLKDIRIVFDRDSKIHVQAYLQVLVKYSSHFTSKQYSKL